MEANETWGGVSREAKTFSHYWPRWWEGIDRPDFRFPSFSMLLGEERRTSGNPEPRERRAPRE